MRSHFSRFLVFVLTLCLFVGGFAPAAGAQDSGKTDVAVLNLEGDKVESQLLKTLTAVLRNEAEKRDDYDVNQSSINLSEVLIVLGCGTPNPTCLKQAAEQVDAQVLVYGSVEKAEDRYEVEVEVFDAEQKTVTQRIVRTLKTDDPVVEFRKQVSKLFQKEADESETRLQIGSNVEGAKIRIRGTVVGSTPLERKGLPPGRYDIEVFKDGYSSWKATVELDERSDIRLWAPLDEPPGSQADASGGGSETVTGGNKSDVAVSDSPPEYVTSKTNWGAWSAVGVGGLSLVGSGVMALLMTNTQDKLTNHYAEAGSFDDAAAWERRRNELIDQGESYELAHRVLLGVGAVSVTTGVVWLLLDQPNEEEVARPFDVFVGPRGASATFRW